MQTFPYANQLCARASRIRDCHDKENYHYVIMSLNRADIHTKQLRNGDFENHAGSIMGEVINTPQPITLGNNWY